MESKYQWNEELFQWERVERVQEYKGCKVETLRTHDDSDDPVYHREYRMTDRQKQMIAGYLPHPRDPALDPLDYYVEDMRGRAVTVHIQQIAFNRYGTSIYQVRTASGNLVHGPYETETELFGGGWYTMGSLYDNREDCIHSEHSMFDDWEELRAIQKEAEA